MEFGLGKADKNMILIPNKKPSYKQPVSLNFNCQVMDKSHKSRTSSMKGMCEKIKRSLISPGKPSFSRAAYVQQDLMAATMLAPSNNMYKTKHGKDGHVVPIEFSRSAFAKAKNANGHIVVEGKTNFKTEGEMNDKFSEYIHKAKITISTTSPDVGARGNARLDSVNKRASAYIDRARQRMKNSATFRAASFHIK